MVLTFSNLTSGMYNAQTTWAQLPLSVFLKAPSRLGQSSQRWKYFLILAFLIPPVRLSHYRKIGSGRNYLPLCLLNARRIRTGHILDRTRAHWELLLSHSTLKPEWK